MAQPWAHERWTAGAAQRGIRSGSITHSAAMVYSDAALPGLFGMRSLPKVELTGGARLCRDDMMPQFKCVGMGTRAHCVDAAQITDGDVGAQDFEPLLYYLYSSAPYNLT